MKGTACLQYQWVENRGSSIQSRWDGDDTQLLNCFHRKGRLAVGPAFTVGLVTLRPLMLTGCVSMKNPKWLRRFQRNAMNQLNSENQSRSVAQQEGFMKQVPSAGSRGIPLSPSRSCLSRAKSLYTCGFFNTVFPGQSLFYFLVVTWKGFVQVSLCLSF